MAGSDKNAHYSVAGGNPTQPSQPLSEAESGEVAGELLNQLKASKKSGPSVSHEARLGMLVISILVFAFGFLVYHKMDMHQRNLTQASISSAADAQMVTQPLTAAAQLASQSEQSAATDPLLNHEDLSEGSPFSDPELAAGDATNSSASQAAAFETLTETSAADRPLSSVPVFSLAEPEDSNSPAHFVATKEMEIPEAQRSRTREAPTLAGDDVGVPDFGSLDLPSDQSEQTLVPQSDRAIDLAQSEPATTLDSGNALTIIPDEQFLQADREDSVPLPVDASPVAAAADGEFDAPPVSDSSSSFLEPEQTVDSATATRSGGEPVLLAMAEPQQDSVFSGGFIADDNSGSAGKAPVSDPADTFPAFGAVGQSPQPQPPKQEHKAAERSTPFGSHGYNAVTQPGAKSGKNPIRTAAGSGSDGKFSLAAFNYQNNSAEPAPDDGSTFDSVVVQDGDNYTKISKRVYGTVQYFSALAVFNQHRIREPKSMRPGMVVLTPPKEVLEERYPQLFIDSQPKAVEPAEFLVLNDGSPAYRVGERETLSEISVRFLGRSSRWIEIYRLNQSVVKDPNKLKAGLILALPADAAEVNVVP